MTLDVLRLIAVNLIAPALILVCFAIKRYDGQLEWVIWLAGSAAYTTYVYLTGMWYLFGYYLRYLLLVGIGLAVLASVGPFGGLPLYHPPGLDDATGLLLLIIFGPLALATVRGYRSPGEGVAATFPFRNGRFYIAHGGSSALVNHHYPGTYSKYAVDIVKLNRSGFRARGFYPRDLERYRIFGETVFSPVDGTVVKTEGGRLDPLPPEEDREHPAGNYVVIECSSTKAFVFLVHLKQHSIMVSEGDRVSAGQPVACAGNSGLSTEPHLHIHCEVDETAEFNLTGQGVPLIFNGRYLVRNHIIRC